MQKAVTILKPLLAGAVLILGILFYLPQAQADLVESHTDLWEYTYHASTTSSGLLTASAVTDMFGTEISTKEPSNIMFRDNQPQGATHWVEWELDEPVTVKSIHLLARHDAPPRDANQRGFSQFTLYYYDGTAFQEVYTYSPSNPYGSGPDDMWLDMEINITETTAQRWKAEFVQWGVPSSAAGPRIHELDGFATLVAGVYLYDFTCQYNAADPASSDYYTGYFYDDYQYEVGDKIFFTDENGDESYYEITVRSQDPVEDETLAGLWSLCPVTTTPKAATLTPLTIAPPWARRL